MVESTSDLGKKRTTRRYRKRTNFKHVPRPVYPIRALWQAASEEERAKAHRTCAAILEYWLGKQSKQETMSCLGVPALRLWQISQRALSGMVVGLLTPPKARGRRAAVTTSPEDDPKQLKKRIADLEEKLRLAEGVIRILRDMPANREEGKPKAAPSKQAAAGKKRGRKTNPQSRAGGDRTPRG